MSQSQPVSAAPNRLVLAPDPSAARDARAWVARVLDRWPEESVEIARLLVSELVTNSVLHAGTPIAVTYRLDGTRARFAVSDGCQNGPVPKRYAPDSPTGRGMRLVVSLSEEWGVQREAEGKAVWFVVSSSAAAAERLDLESFAAGVAGKLRGIAALETPRSQTPDATGGDSDGEPRAETDSGLGTAKAGADAVDSVDVQVLALPLDVYLEAEQHNDAVVRELTLIAQSSDSSSGLEVPRRLLELATEVRAAFSQASDGLRAQVEDAARRGQRTVDIHMSVPRRGWEGHLRLADWLDEVDRHCEDGELLTLASSPRLRHFRAWFVRQVVDQMNGMPPIPWDGTLES